jgi:hypothetical protein
VSYPTYSYQRATQFVVYRYDAGDQITGAPTGLARVGNPLSHRRRSEPNPAADE